MMVAICRMQAFDLPRVLEIQAAGYAPEFCETKSLFAARLTAAPETAWIAKRGLQICGYLMAYRSRLGNATSWNAPFQPVRDGACLYLHDLAICPTAAGQGIGPALIRHAWSWAGEQGLTHSALIAVQNSRPFWERQGYRDENHLTAVEQRKLASYQGPAVYLSQRLQTTLAG